MNHDRRYLDGNYEASQAEGEAADLARLIEDEKEELGPGGLALAHGARAVTYALLALRETASTAGDDIGYAVTDAGVTLGLIAGTVTAPGVPGTGAPAPLPRATDDDAPDYVLRWVPAREPGKGFWDVRPVRDDLDRTWLFPPVVIAGRDADAAALARYLTPLLGYEAAVSRRSWRLTGRLRPLFLGFVPEWEVRPAGGRCDGTTAAVLAVDAGGRYLVAPASRPGPIAYLAPPAVHAGGTPWNAAASAALSALGVTASELRQAGSGWRYDCCGRGCSPLGPGHMWVVHQAPLAWGEPLDGARWATAAELQDLAARTIACADGTALAPGGGPGLDPAWIGWLADEGVIDVDNAGRVRAGALAAGHGSAA